MKPDARGGGVAAGGLATPPASAFAPFAAPAFSFPPLEGTPLVSVVMPAYNARPYLEQAIRSVLDQDYPAIELIVVDDGSSDGTPDDAARFGARVRVLRQHNAGPAAARNKGMAAARGELIAFLDADDVWLPGKLSAQVRCLREHPAVAIVYGGFLRWCANADGAFAPPPAPLVAKPALPLVAGQSGWIYTDLLFDNIVHVITAMVRRPVLDCLGGFDETLRTGEDYDFWLRASRQFQAARLNQTLACYRLHAASTTRVPRAENNEYQVLRKMLEKYGATGPDGVSAAPSRVRGRLFQLCFSHGYFHYWRGSPGVAAQAFRAALGHAWWRPKAWAYWALSTFRAHFARFRSQ